MRSVEYCGINPDKGIVLYDMPMHYTTVAYGDPITYLYISFIRMYYCVILDIAIFANTDFTPIPPDDGIEPYTCFLIDRNISDNACGIRYKSIFGNNRFFIFKC